MKPIGRPRSAPRSKIKCRVCGVEFEERQSKHRVVCSSRCRGIVMSRFYAAKQAELICVFCGAAYRVIASRAGKSHYCSRQCQNTAQARVNASLRGDVLRYTGRGRSYIKQGGRHQHRVIAEQTIGRGLVPGEVVHHLNGHIRDNRPENLTVLASQGIHASLHSTKNRICVVKGCGRKHAAKGFCNRHWKQNRKQKIEVGEMLK